MVIHIESTMPDLEQTTIMGALSALTGAKVRPHTDYERKKGTPDQILAFNDFLHTVHQCNSQKCLVSQTDALTLSSVPDAGMPVLKKRLFVDIENFLDPQFDYDFRNRSDSEKCKRGDESYTRPWGWYRVALKVLNKYPDGNTWLGSDGWRSSSVQGEWPVSFHGTGIEEAKAISSSYYKPGPGKVYGRGVYSTPEINAAKDYIKEFTDRKTGKNYRVVLQNRINPSKRKITQRQEYWLIPVPRGTLPEEERRIVEESIRPYGILIQEV